MTLYKEHSKQNYFTLACRRYSRAASISPPFLACIAAILNSFCRLTRNSYSFSFLDAGLGGDLLVEGVAEGGAGDRECVGGITVAAGTPPDW